ncbi:MAG: hypothetical protein CFH10_00403 [Alphaproteobacteria bacterium MarineAlpha4_Bin2]|nr:MAG: hypothetical protein CFH10_00403 [Alphaproteobacteria bacterium MarineAlpha4_Bin2]
MGHRVDFSESADLIGGDVCAEFRYEDIKNHYQAITFGG